MGKVKTFARRTFLVGSAAIAGGVAFGYWKFTTPYDNPLNDQPIEGGGALTPYVKIDQSGVSIITPRAEMGQGVHTTLAALVAEELDVDFAKIAVEHGPASYAYYNEAMLSEAAPYAPTDHRFVARSARSAMAIPAKFLALQLTGGSSSTPDAYVKMRKAGAAARLVLLDAAAARLGTPVDRLQTDNGAVVMSDGTRLSYEELAVDAAKLDPPSDPPLKPREAWRYLGKSLPRVDMVAKCTGTAEFASDVNLPGMVYATVKMNPRLGGSLNGFDDSAARVSSGYIKTVELPGGLGILADNTWRAFRAADLIRCEWGDAPYPPTSDGILQQVSESFVEEQIDSRYRDDGDVAAVLEDSEVIEAEYTVPILAHATMEPMSAVAWLRDGRLDVWAGTQAPTAARDVAAKVSGLKSEAISIHTTYLGGGFGRRAEGDFIEQVVRLAGETGGRPVKMMWSREEDMCHDAYRPPAIARFKGAVSDGAPVAWDCGIASPSVMESQFGRMDMPAMGPDKLIVDGAVFQPYAIPNYRVTGYRAPASLPIGYWRSVGASYNGFFHECFMDEMALAAGADPLEMRLRLLNHEPSREVLRTVGEMSGWSGPLAQGRGRGVAFTLSFGVPTAEVVEVAMTERGVKIEKAWIAADVGTALDPGILEAQLSGGMIFGLTAAVQGEITLENGEVQQTNFHDYDGLRMYQTPEIEVRVLENGKHIRGIGEPGTPPAPAALANAVYSLTGQRYRSLPLNKHLDFV